MNPICDLMKYFIREENVMPQLYNIVRFFADPNKPARVVKRGVTLEEAQEHCNDPETSSRTCTSATGKARTRKHGPWFDGWRAV